MTEPGAKKRRNLQSGLIMPVVTVLLSCFLFIGVGFAGLASAVEVSGQANTSGIIIELKNGDDTLTTGGFSTDQTVKYSDMGSNVYSVLTGNYKLGESALIIDDIDPGASGKKYVGMSIEVEFKLAGDNEYTGTAPYNITPTFILKNSSGEEVDMSYIEINAGKDNTFHLEFYGKISSAYTHNGTSPPEGFVYKLQLSVETL